MKKLTSVLAQWPIMFMLFIFLPLNGKSDSAKFKVSSEFFNGQRLRPGEFVLDLEKSKEEFRSKKEAFCSMTKLPADQQKTLEILSKTNQHICESKRKGKNILEFCTCVTLNSSKGIGGYSALKKSEMESYKIILEDLAITQSIRQKFNDLFGIALSVQNASTHAPIWKVISRHSDDDLVKECSPQFMGNFMQNAACEEKGLARMNKVLSSSGLDIFPDQDKKNGGAKFNQILSQKLEQRLGLPSVRSCLEIGPESVKDNSEREEIIKGNSLLLKVLNKNLEIAKLSIDDFQVACAFLKHDPFISQRMFADIRNKSLISGQQDLSKKRSMDCALPEDAKTITNGWLKVVLSDLQQQKKSLFKDKKGDLSPSDFQTVLDAHYRESSQEMLSQCRAVKKEILKVCQIAQKDSFSPAEMGFNPGPTSILKASHDVALKYKKNFPPPPPSDDKIKSQMDQLMCFMHGDANGLVAPDASSYAQNVATFAKHEDLESITGKEDNGSLYEESEEGKKIDQWIAKVDNDSHVGLQNDYQKHPDLYHKKEDLSSPTAKDSSTLDPAKNGGSESKKVSHVEKEKAERATEKEATHLPPGERPLPPASFSGARSAEFPSTPTTSDMAEDAAKSLAKKEAEGRRISELETQLDRLQKDKKDLQSQQRTPANPSQKSTVSKLSAANELDQSMADYEIGKDKKAINKKQNPDSHASDPSASSSSASTSLIPAKVPSYSASTFAGNEGAGSFNIVPHKKGSSVTKYASFKDENGKEIVVDLASAHILILSENQFAQMTEEEFKDWHDKSKGEAIYIMDRSGAIKRAIPIKIGDHIKYMCLNEKEGKLTPVECRDEKVLKVEQVAMTATRPAVTISKQSKSPPSHKDLVKLLQIQKDRVKLLQIQTAKRVQKTSAP